MFKRKSLFLFSGAILVIFGLIGLLGTSTRGLPARFDSGVLQYAAAASDVNRDPQKCAFPDPRHLDEKTICKVGVPQKTSPDFLLWGDSHANALEPAVAVMAREHKASGWIVTYAGCPALAGVDRADNFIEFSCPEISDTVLKIISRNKIKNVILVTRWDMYALGWEKGGTETAREPFISFTTKDGRRLTRREAFAAAFQETVSKLRALGVNVWVVRQVPPQLVHVPSALAKAQYLGRDPEALKRPYAEILARNRFIDDVFSAAAKNYPMNFIDPAETFCPQQKSCLIAAEGRALYSDDTHLSYYGALWSQTMLEPFFKSLQQQK